MLKCKICGTEFPPVMDKHYIARENGIQGGLVQLSNGKQEGKIYDAFDCPMCGCQVVVQDRKRTYGIADKENKDA